MRVSVWIAIVCSGTGQVLLAQRSLATRNAGRWNFFGGGVDAGEHPKDTALRELAEEAGIRVRRSALAYLGECLTGDKRNLLFAIASKAEFQPRLNHESQDWRWVPMAGLAGMPMLHGPTQKLAPLLYRLSPGLGVNSRREAREYAER